MGLRGACSMGLDNSALEKWQLRIVVLVYLTVSSALQVATTSFGRYCASKLRKGV